MAAAPYFIFNIFNQIKIFMKNLFMLIGIAGALAMASCGGNKKEDKKEDKKEEEKNL